MAKWVVDGRPEFMDVAYTTEKSIQDELDRTSKAEVMTMVISYLLMFVYIFIALGKVRRSFVGCFVSFSSTSFSTSRNCETRECTLERFPDAVISESLKFEFQTESRIVLSVGGIIIVLASVGCSLGVFGYIGVPTTLLTIEV